MAFTGGEFREFLQLIEEHPSWRAELRRWVLTEELLSLPQVVHQLAEAQRRTEEQVGQLADHLAVLTQRVGQLSAGVGTLVQLMDQLTQRVQSLADLLLRQGHDLERLKGSDLEQRYRDRAHSYFSRLVRRVRVLPGDELSRLLDDAVRQGQLTEEQADEVLQADVVVRGRRRTDDAEVYLVAEVSWGVGLSDVQRASERAALLARTGLPTLPVVAGAWITPEAEEPARALKVWRVTDGAVTAPDAASPPW